MNEISALLPLFEAQRPRLRAVAFRMLGSRTDADDAVQETWLRLSRSADTAVENFGGWLTTVISHICLDMLRARKTRGDDIAHSEDKLEPTLTSTPNPQEDDLLLADSVSAALLVVLQRLSPAERVAFVLHDMFDLSFEEIAPILDRTPEAARQLASRARRRVRGDDSTTSPQHSDRQRQREMVSAFLTAAKGGDLQGLLAALDPNVVFRTDAAARKLGGPAELRGAAAVAEIFKGRAQAARAMLIDGILGISVAPGGKQLLLLQLTFGENGITTIEAIADPASMADAELEEPTD
jgi:RNA polymerase sigma-70 factor (ECF subfamily)